MNCDKAFIFAPIMDYKKRTRLVKIVDFFADFASSVKYLGWRRNRNENIPANESQVQFEAILSGGGYGKLSRPYYVVWFFSVMFASLRIPKKSLVYCLGFETALPVYISSLIKRHVIIFDDADRFSMAINWPSPIKKLIGFLEKKLSRRVALHIVPGLSRYSWNYDNMRVLSNTPSSASIRAVRSSENEFRKYKDGSFIVNINGWLGETRGLPTFLRVAQRSESLGLKICFWLAGRLDGQSANELVDMANVRYFGELDQITTLAMVEMSDTVLTYYDPAIPINKLAESNKWGDCLCLGKPFIVNSEVKTAEKYVAERVALSAPYQDDESLLGVIITMMEEGVNYSPKKFGGAQVPFDIRFREIVEAVWENKDE